MLPDTLDLPTVLAASLRFDDHMTARDRALTLAVAFLATAPDDDEAMVPDLDLRRALGDMRRPDEAAEFARYDRLEKGHLISDERIPDLADGVPAPVVPRGMRRILLKGAHRWIVDKRLRSSMTVYAGERYVRLPLAILRASRSRYTLPLALRALAWGAGEHDRRWRRRESPDIYVLRIPLDEFRSDLGVDPSKSPSDMMRFEIEPAIREIATLTDLTIDVDAVKAPSLKRGGGRVRWIDVMVDRSAPLERSSDIKYGPLSPSAEIVPMPVDPDPWGEEVEF